MPAKGQFKSHCIKGHERTKETVDPKSGSCKLCRAVLTKRWRQTPEAKAKRNAQQKKWALNNPNKVLAINLKTLYGLTIEQYNVIIEKQKGLCPICNIALSERKMFGADRPVVDHNHETNEVRGVLCSNCNCALGLFKDSCTVLENAIQYLRERQV